MNARGVAVLLGAMCLLLGGALAWSLTSGGADSAQDSARQLAIERMVATTKGTLDSHPDPQVSKVLLPSVKDGHDGQVTVASNRFGMREIDWAEPKPAGTVRVVLLGDSFIYGMGVPAEQRLGVALQRELQQHATAAPAPQVEVLHLGITSWNVVAECAFLRRQLSLLQPDLVIQHIVPNDLDDVLGVRGFGAPAKLVPLRPEQTETYLSMVYCRDALEPKAVPLLPWAQDGESRGRMDALVAALAGLRAALAAQGCGYLVEVNWHSYCQVAAHELPAAVPDDELLYLPSAHYLDKAFRISAADEHWNAAGHEEQARLLFGAIRAHKLLPTLALSAWPEAEQHAAETWKQGRAEATAEGALQARLARQKVASALQAGDWDVNTAGQVYGGLAKDNLVAPVCVLVLAAGGTQLRVTGEALARPEMDGATLHVVVEGSEVGTHVLHTGQPFDIAFPLPASKRAWLAVRLQSSDFVYDGPDQRRCVSFRLRRIAIEP